MNHRKYLVALLALALPACSIIDQTDPHPNGDPYASKQKERATIAAGGVNCDAQAKSKLSLFEKPDTYPISDSEKKNAYQALYDECMKGNSPVIAAGPKPGFEVAAAGTNFANLSPAAGGNPPSRTGVTVANGVTVIDTSQFNNLSPAAGGMSGIATGTNPNGGTVVVVQSSPGGVVTPIAVPVAAAVPTHPAAIPVTPTGAPVASVVTTTTTTQKPAEDADETAKPKKTAKAKSHKTTETAANPNDKRSRFAKNAVAVKGLNAYEPSAGSLVDQTITTNPPAQKF